LILLALCAMIYWPKLGEKLEKRSRKGPSRASQFHSHDATAAAIHSGMTASQSFGHPRWTTLHSYLILTLATILCLAPFSGRAFHVDDTLFVLAARQIAQHPSDPYGFEVNWESVKTQMSEVTQNPPLASYYIALIARLLGWSERALHWGFILIAIALILGTYRLARKLTRLPLLAALCALLTPGILVSASSVMCDTMMLALWTWAAYFWLEGLEPRNGWFLFVSAVLTAASALTKYFGASLILLLLVYSIVRLRRLGAYVLYLLIPVAVLLAYEFWTASLYGHGLLQGAVDFARSERSVRQGSFAGSAVVALSFGGGCSLVGLSFTALIWSRKQAAAALALSGIAGLAFAEGWLDTGWGSSINPVAAEAQHSLPWLISGELVPCIAAGIFVMGLAIKDFWAARSSDSLFLGLWILGTFFFAGFVNWTVNARSVLPLIPAVAILLARRLDAHPLVGEKIFVLHVVMILSVSALVSVWIAAADSELANSGRTAAAIVYNKTHEKGASLWFVGHWGFQYYMEQLGANPLNAVDLQPHSGDFVAIPENNTNSARILPKFIASQENVELPMRSWATTISSDLGAGFYSSSWGPLPYAIGPVPSERYSIIRLGALPGQDQPR
jgi:4-amino-4-deoxy-L-arabinose transferase-like glycosyltransferase